MDVANQIFEINDNFPTDADARLRELISLWKKIDEPKENNKNSYLIIAKIVSIYLKKQDYENSWTWAQNAILYSDNHNQAGESEFLLGKVAFEMGNLENSKEWFKKVKKKSGVRLFKEEKKEYLELIK